MDDGKILMKVGHRFCLFDSDGVFMDEIEFSFKDDNSKPQAINGSIAEAPKKPIPDHKRMNLLSMSENN